MKRLFVFCLLNLLFAIASGQSDGVNWKKRGYDDAHFAEQDSIFKLID
jgi:hypothetical protein